MIKFQNENVNIQKFPNGESLVKFPTDFICDHHTITFKFESNEDIINLILVKGEFSRRFPNRTCDLIIAYMPYSRMDRAEDGSTFTLKIIADLINSMNFNKVTVLEPHSDVTCALLNNSVAVNVTEALFNEVIGYAGANIFKDNSDNFFDFNVDEDFVCYPDAGAQKSYGKMGDYKSIIGMKNRDFETGRIKNLDIYIPQGDLDQKDGTVTPVNDIRGKKVIIVDDLCSKGGTFIMTAKKLKELGASSIALIVTHCENSIFDGDIFEKDLDLFSDFPSKDFTPLIDMVITTDTIINLNRASNRKGLFIASFMDFV